MGTDDSQRVHEQRPIRGTDGDRCHRRVCVCPRRSVEHGAGLASRRPVCRAAAHRRRRSCRPPVRSPRRPGRPRALRRASRRVSSRPVSPGRGDFDRTSRRTSIDAPRSAINSRRRGEPEARSSFRLDALDLRFGFSRRLDRLGPLRRHSSARVLLTRRRRSCRPRGIIASRSRPAPPAGVRMR